MITEGHSMMYGSHLAYSCSSIISNTWTMPLAASRDLVSAGAATSAGGSQTMLPGKDDSSEKPKNEEAKKTKSCPMREVALASVP